MNIRKLFIALLVFAFAVVAPASAMTDFPNGVSSYGIPLPAGQHITSGSYFFVDSTHSTRRDAADHGGSWGKPFATLDFAIGRCAANSGAIIFLAANHAETLDSSVGTDIVFDVAGITVIGIGFGDDRPTFSWADEANATISVTAADIVLRNIVFDGSSTATDGPDDMFDINAAGFQLLDSEVIFADATEAATLVITGDANADRMKILRTRFYGTSAETGCDSAVTFTSTAEDIEIGWCTFTGDFAEAAIDTDQAITQINFHDLDIVNYQDDDHGILLDGAALGVIRNVNIGTNAYATAIDPGSCEVYNVLWYDDDHPGDNIAVSPLAVSTGAATLSATDLANIKTELTSARGPYYLATVTTGGTTTFADTAMAGFGTDYFETNWYACVIWDQSGASGAPEGECQDINAYNTTTGQFTVGSAFSTIETNDVILIKRREDMVIDSAPLDTTPLAGSLATFIAGGAGGQGTQLHTSKSLVDIIGTDGNTVQDTDDGIAGMLGVNDNDNAMATEQVVENNDGSMYERLEHLQALSDDVLAGLRMTGHDVGNVYYVDEAIGNTSYAGTSWVLAKATIVQGYDLTVDDKGDIVFVAPDHEETLAAATILFDEAGVMIIGLGSGEQMPMITMTAGASKVQVTGADVTIENIHFYSTTVDNVVTIDADASGLIVRGNRFTGSGAGHVLGIDLATTLSDIVIEDNYVYDLDTDGDAFVNVTAGAATNLVIRNNRIWGDYDDAAVNSDQTNLNIVIKDNVINNVNAGQHAIQLTNPATGYIHGNILSGTVPGAIFDPGSCIAFDNKIIESDVTDIPDRAYMEDGGWFYAVATFLLDGAANTDDLFTVTGTVEVKVYGSVTETLTVNSDTISIGTADSVALMIAATGGDAPMASGDIWTSATIAKSAAAPTTYILDDDNIAITQSGTNLADGTVVIHVFWRPLTEGASVIVI